LRLVVLQGAGGHCSYGASVEEHRKAHAPAMVRSLSRLVRQVARFPAPVAALVEGRCLGGAFEVTLACHLVFVTPDAQMGCPEIKLGVFPPVLAALGPLRLGGALSDRLLLTGETMTGAHAVASGFAAPVSGFDAFLDWYRAGPARLSAEALRIATRAARLGAASFDERLQVLESLYLERVLASHDGNEGIEAFIARRAPRWDDA
jgi:cyclohexa-1,5-dienecarbonyl-CoA hydratase